MKISCDDVGSNSNKGDVAIAHGLLKVLKEACPDAKLNYFADTPQETKEELKVSHCYYSKYACPYTGISRLLPHNKLKLFWRAIRTKLWFKTNWNWLLNKYEKEIFHILSTNDVHISMGGSIVNDFYWSTLYYNLLFFNYLKGKGKKVIILAHSIDPIITLPYRNYLRKTLDKIDLIVVREALSLNYLKDLGCNMNNVKLASDAAFLFDFKDKPMLKIKKPSIGISCRYWKWFAGGQEEIYKKALVDISNYLIDKGYDIWFLSTGWDKEHSDLEFSNTIRSRIKGETYVLDKEPTAKELANILSQFDLLISTRMHPTILGMQSFVPCVGTLYEEKTRGVFQSLGVGDYVLDIKTLTYPTLKEKVDKALANRKKIITFLKKTIPRERERAKLNIKFLKEVLNG